MVGKWQRIRKRSIQGAVGHILGHSDLGARKFTDGVSY